jgi:hypothetical protein
MPRERAASKTYDERPHGISNPTACRCCDAAREIIRNLDEHSFRTVRESSLENGSEDQHGCVEPNVPDNAPRNPEHHSAVISLGAMSNTPQSGKEP